MAPEELVAVGILESQPDASTPSLERLNDEFQSNRFPRHVRKERKTSRPHLTSKFLSEVLDLPNRSMVISQNASLGWHRDKHNLLGSGNWAVPLGLFQGGETRILLEGQTQEEAEKKVAGSRIAVGRM